MRYMPVEIGETVEDIMLCIGCFLVLVLGDRTRFIFWGVDKDHIFDNILKSRLLEL